MQSPLLLSCKLTNAALKFLERRGEDLEPLYERFDWPVYYLRDPSSWLEADRLEAIFNMLIEIYGARVENETGVDFFSAVGHASPLLRAWGALDSVLKIVPGVRELYQQPDRFLASFISPQPQIQGLQHSAENVVFRIGFSDVRHPHTARYLRAILESLPEFIGKPRAHVLWNHGNVSIEWSERQVPFVTPLRTNESEGPSLSPDLLRTILVDLATAQRELEVTRRSVQEKDAIIHALQNAPAVPSKHETVALKNVDQALHEIYKLGDYFARAQQIVTLLRAPSSRSTVALQSSQAEALIRRTAWDRVSSEAPFVIRKASMLLRGEPVEAEAPLAVPATVSNDVVPIDIPVAAVSKTASLKKTKSLKTPSFFDS
ncbi:hypothetical protein BH10BDE1_BH10BDE1_24790 [soil metagenome]